MNTVVSVFNQDLVWLRNNIDISSSFGILMGPYRATAITAQVRKLITGTEVRSVNSVCALDMIDYWLKSLNHLRCLRKQESEHVREKERETADESHWWVTISVDVETLVCRRGQWDAWTLELNQSQTLQGPTLRHIARDFCGNVILTATKAHRLTDTLATIFYFLLKRWHICVVLQSSELFCFVAVQPFAI